MVETIAILVCKQINCNLRMNLPTKYVYKRVTGIKLLLLYRNIETI